MDRHEPYIPAFGWQALTPLYDPAARWLFREGPLKQALIARARIAPGMRVLDAGCGTGTLALMVKRTHPQATVVGLDGDARMLAIAHARASKAGAAIAFDEGLADRLPYPDASFDRVLSTMVLHHLGPDGKRRAAREFYRVLKPGGELHVADLGKPHGAVAYALSLVTRRLERAAENIAGKLPQIFADAGFGAAEETAHRMTVVGTVALYRARK